MQPTWNAGCNGGHLSPQHFHGEMGDGDRGIGLKFLLGRGKNKRDLASKTKWKEKTHSWKVVL